MVFTLNPNDNHGLREDLTRAYLRLGRAQDALRVCERYPDDLAGLTYNQVLALHRLGRFEEARAALAEARRNFPKVYKTLVHPKPRKPPINPGAVTYGGRDEAWLYREAHLDLWREGGALEWVKASSRGAA
jgi:tetratricopeptide (TPR) repeat protein